MLEKQSSISITISIIKVPDLKTRSHSQTEQFTDRVEMRLLEHFSLGEVCSVAQANVFHFESLAPEDRIKQ